MMDRFKKETDFSNDITAKQHNERNSLKQTSIILSFLCVISVAVNYVLSIALGYSGLRQFPVWLLISLGVITVCAVFMPFVIGGHFLGGVKTLICPNYKPKKNPFEILLTVIFGFGACITANFLSVFFLATDEKNSVESYGNNIGTIVLMLIVFAVLPAVCEEFAFRGIVMGSLRKYGDKIAIVISALLFALLHQSLSAVIFAFCSGMILGLVRKSAGSLIPSIIVHFLNNGLGVIMTVLSDIMPTEKYILIYCITIAVSLIMAIGALVLLNKRKFGLFILSDNESVLNGREKFIIVLKNIFLYFVIFVVVTFILT